MTPELKAIADFLGDCIPFDDLPEAEIESTVAAIEIAYYRKGHVFEGHNDEAGLRIIRSGAAELRGDKDQLIDRLGESISFNLKGLQCEEPGIKAILIEDSLIYIFPEEDYQELRRRQRDFDRFFHSQRSRRLRRAARHEPNPSDMMRQIKDLMAADVLSIPPDTTIQATAQLMSERRLSSVLIMEGDDLQGIVTDRDIRSRAVALGIDYNSSVADIMTPDPQTISPDATLFDATLFMTRSNFHHVPVVKDEKVVGILTASDLMLARQDDPVFLVQHIGRQTSLEGIKAITDLLPNLLVQWVNADIRAPQVSHIFTAISDAVATRLIELTISDMGPAPVPFCWLGFGSQGRGEQLLGADQDNGLVISDEMKAEHEPWFKAFANKVCDGLNTCGYVYCPGDIMAKTDIYRLPLSGWKKTVDDWTQKPTQDALMRVSIFFDLRSIYGDPKLCDQLQQHMLSRVSGNSIFFALLAENVLDSPPPLGIFRRFVVDRNGDHRDELNIKKSGLMSITDIARIHALFHGVAAVNSLERMQALVKCKAMTMSDSRNLQDALRIVSQIRVNAQARQIVAGDSVSNWLNPDDFSKLVRKQLRDSFTIVMDAQTGVKNKYRQGLG
jgi:CBS domain-containing protein